VQEDERLNIGIPIPPPNPVACGCIITPTVVAPGKNPVCCGCIANPVFIGCNGANNP
jgi:hypothetical protein